MELRSLEKADFDAFEVFIRSVYRDSPYSMWFSGEPGRSELMDLFNRKLKEAKEHRMIDVVAADKDSMIGECEIVAKGSGVGIVGMLVRKERRRKGLGRELLQRGIERSKALGLNVLLAEVLETNKDAAWFFSGCGFEKDDNVRKAVEIDGKAYNYIVFRKSL
ncbi:MAG: GNAT family N-acetyltransferase [Candidatus Micrarchaeota archaeon]|nr:GNAT family N-acetyltransferase [Candidatus Micrarchaeota archaeon]